MTNPVCAIVGAGEGLGRALAAKFASREFDIALISRSEANSSAAIEAATATASSANVRFFSADASRALRNVATGGCGKRGKSSTTRLATTNGCWASGLVPSTSISSC